MEEFETPQDLCFELAGPRLRLYFELATVEAAIVTCGGSCPGMQKGRVQSWLLMF